MKRTASVLMLLSAPIIGCGSHEQAVSNETALDLQLVQDRNLNTAEDVAAAVRTLDLVIDSSDGLYPPGSERAGDPSVENRDSDPALELVARVSVPAERLPLVRLRRGGLPDVPIDLRVEGFRANGTERVAYGGVDGLRFTPGTTAVVSVLFNIRDTYLPLRVVEVLPGMAFCSPYQFIAVFSKPVDLASLSAPGNFEITGGTRQELQLDANGLIARWIGDVQAAWADNYYEVWMQTGPNGVVSTTGELLDQVPGTPGFQPFHERFPRGRCPGVDPVPCGQERGTSCPGAPRITCVQGQCVLADCASASCASGFVCNPWTTRCEVDCRSYGAGDVCPADRPRCDSQQGTCGTE